MTPLEVFLVAALTGLGGYAGKLVLDYINDLKKQRDKALDGWQGQVGATEKLTAAVHELAKDRGAQ